MRDWLRGPHLPFPLVTISQGLKKQMVGNSRSEELAGRKRITALSVLFWKLPNWAKNKMFGTEKKGILKAWGSNWVWVSVSCGYLTDTRGSVIISSST